MTGYVKIKACLDNKERGPGGRNGYLVQALYQQGSVIQASRGVMCIVHHEIRI